ncbi:MAG: right-handed parallel beta-helix repeat-containing protein, partial [Planctomycetes bacterium]|nr:right-handed parallel beta-helix repeat-containing protein [Planctomycetota bacterium]
VGGGLDLDGASPILIGCTIRGNAAIHRGGGVFVGEGSTVAMTGCVIVGNIAGEPLSSPREGGGLWCEGGATLDLTNSTIAGNSAVDMGGALVADETSVVRLMNCTITGNSASWFGGIYGPAHVTNTIFWVNRADTPPNPLEHCLTDRDPLFVNPGTFSFSRYDTVTLGSLEVRLPDFIAASPDLRLRPGSPAIDAGTAEGAPDVDAAGLRRPRGAGIDIGAYEFWGPSYRRGDVNADGRVDIADALPLAMYIYGGAPIACVASADANDDGGVDAADPIYLLAYLFRGGPPPGEPFRACGADPTPNDLECAVHPACP